MLPPVGGRSAWKYTPRESKRGFPGVAHFIVGDFANGDNNSAFLCVCVRVFGFGVLLNTTERCVKEGSSWLSASIPHSKFGACSHAACHQHEQLAVLLLPFAF
jgi:hypothetical protein